MARTASKEDTKATAAHGAADHLERQNITFDALFRLIEKIGTTFDVSKIVSLFLMTVMGQLKVKRASLYLIVPEKRSLEPYRSIGLAHADALRPIHIESGLVRWLREAAAPVNLDELCSARNEAAEEDEETARGLVEAGFSRGIALVDQGTLLGMLVYSGTVTNEPFTDFDNELLSVLSRVASLTIRNAFLYQEAVASKLELERFSEVKRQFMSHTSHELRTPLTVLVSALWSLEPEGMGDGVLVDMARDAVTRLQSKVDYLLSLNEIELAGTDFNFEPCEISGLVEDALREIIPELEEKQVRVSVDDHAVDRKAMADAGKMRIVLRSILDNAMNFVGRGGTITIVTRVSESSPGHEEGVEIGDWRVSLPGRRDPGMSSSRAAEEEGAASTPPARSVRELRGSPYIVVSIADDGIGIPHDEIQILAEPFAMASNSANRDVKGLGIGLSVSQRIVAGHGGKIFCKSELGQGARFSIWLPLNT
jgi:signal transduction histidine kinase